MEDGPNPMRDEFIDACLLAEWFPEAHLALGPCGFQGFQIILADPPWRYKDSRCKGAAEKQYLTMSLDEIIALPIEKICAPDAMLLLWATGPLQPEAIRVMSAWGFDYKNMGFLWVKTNRDGSPYMGLGHYTRSGVEPVLLGKRGKGVPRRSKSVLQVVHFPAIRHSEKPPIIHRDIERLFGDVPRVELFARRRVPGWTCLGNEISGLDIEHELCLFPPNYALPEPRIHPLRGAPAQRRRFWRGDSQAETA